MYKYSENNCQIPGDSHNLQAVTSHRHLKCSVALRHLTHNKQKTFQISISYH